MTENVQGPGRSLGVPLQICLSRRIAPRGTALERRVRPGLLKVYPFWVHYLTNWRPAGKSPA